MNQRSKPFRLSVLSVPLPDGFLLVSCLGCGVGLVWCGGGGVCVGLIEPTGVRGLRFGEGS